MVGHFMEIVNPHDLEDNGGSTVLGQYCRKYIVPLKVGDVKINVEIYSKFFDKTFYKWYKLQLRSFKVVMQDHAVTFCKADCPPCKK